MRTPTEQEWYRNFWARVEVRDAHECWPWKGYRLPDGYGRVDLIRERGGPRRVQVAHVLVYNQTRGPVPAGWVVHHRCENKWCVNPSHLQRMTILEHKLHHQVRTQCKRGHAPEDYVIQGSHHACRACQREKRRAL